MLETLHYLIHILIIKLKKKSFKLTVDYCIASIQSFIESFTFYEIRKQLIVLLKENMTISITFPRSSLSVGVQAQRVPVQVSGPHCVVAPGPGNVCIEFERKSMLYNIFERDFEL